MAEAQRNTDQTQATRKSEYMTKFETCIDLVDHSSAKELGFCETACAHVSWRAGHEELHMRMVKALYGVGNLDAFCIAYPGGRLGRHKLCHIVLEVIEGDFSHRRRHLLHRRHPFSCSAFSDSFSRLAMP